MRRSIVWFTTDLRLDDNEVLVSAIKHSDEIIPVYCFDDAHYRIISYRFQKTGKFRFQFICESLIDLDNRLRALGSGLMVVRGNPADVLGDLANQFDVSAIFAKSEVAPEELKTQSLVQLRLSDLNCRLETFHISNLLHPDDLPFSRQQFPDVYTDFRKRVEASLKVRQPLSSPESIHSPEIPAMVLPGFSEMGLDPFVMDERAAIHFKGGETEALTRVQTYFSGTHAVANYKETRNGLIGENFSSKFSAWLALGCLSPRSIYAELKKYESIFVANESTYWLVFELLWRDFFAFVMNKYQSRMFQKNGIRNHSFNISKHDQDAFDAWKNGDTANEFINANMIELKLTGFMSNRGRQNVASYLCNDLKLDWRYGAAYFEEQLIDYDVNSNWGNWAYLAGVGHDPRGQRAFNIDKQADQYDKDRSYRNLWLKNH